jgi:hypothetical protein
MPTFFSLPAFPFLVLMKCKQTQISWKILKAFSTIINLICGRHQDGLAASSYFSVLLLNEHDVAEKKPLKLDKYNFSNTNDVGKTF